MISLFSCWASWSSTRWPAQRGLRNTVRCRPPTPSAAALVASPSRLARPPAKALAKHWQSIGKVIWMRHRACGWHAACCFCRFLQASDETQAETCDKKEQEIKRKYNQETWMVENLSPNALGSKLLKAVSFCTLMHSIKTSASGGGSCLIATLGTILQLRSWFSNHLEW